MAYDIRMVKLVSGEMVIGKHDAATNRINDASVLQTLPTQQGVQMMLMPYGYPFEQEFSGSISYDHVIFTFNKCPDELQTKYLEACTNLTLAGGGLGGFGPGASSAGLIRGK